MKSLDIRNYAKLNGVKLWEIAERLGCNDGNFSRKLRKAFSDELKAEIFEIIDEIAAGRKERFDERFKGNSPDCGSCGSAGDG